MTNENGTTPTLSAAFSRLTASQMTTEQISALMQNLYPALTPRPAQCVFWTALNLSAKEIADKMGVSVAVVRSHLRDSALRLNLNTQSSMREIRTLFLTDLLVSVLLHIHQPEMPDLK